MPRSRDEAWEYLRTRFGVDRDALQDMNLVRQSGDFWIVPEAAETLADMDAETRGFRFLRDQDIGLKPTTYALQFLGGRITRNRVVLTRDELVRVLDGDLIDRDADSDGYVALVYADRVIGCGLYHNDTVSSRIPKGRGKELRQAITAKERRNSGRDS